MYKKKGGWVWKKICKVGMEKCWRLLMCGGQRKKKNEYFIFKSFYNVNGSFKWRTYKPAPILTTKIRNPHFACQLFVECTVIFFSRHQTRKIAVPVEKMSIAYLYNSRLSMNLEFHTSMKMFALICLIQITVLQKTPNGGHTCLK